MGKLIDLKGKRFGMLTVIERAPQSAPKVRWLCVCDCGGETTVDSQHLRKGAVISCGCYHKKELAARRRKHGHSGTRLYDIWCAMRARCHSRRHVAYGYYGGRGISVCAEWMDFTNFRAWAIQNGYADGLEIDRIDNDLGYSPDNCRWVTHAENMKNLRCQKIKKDKV